MYLLKIGLLRITPANLNASRQNFTAELQISRVKILAPWAKGAPNGDRKGGCLCLTGTMNLFFFVTGQIGMKFGNKRQSVSSIEH